MCEHYLRAIFTIPVWALGFSIFLGAIVTYLWANCLYSCFASKDEEERRDRRIAAINGMVIRSFITSLVIWLPQAVGPTVAALLAAHALIAWAGLDNKEKPSRIRYTISMLYHIVSIFWAIAWGLWATSAA